MPLISVVGVLWYNSITMRMVYLFCRNARTLWKSLTVSLLVCFVFIVSPPPATAHPLDEFYQVTFISVGADTVELAVELFPGVLVAPQVIEAIDTDGDEQVSQAEADAYAQRFVSDVRLEINDVATPLTVEAVEIPPLLELQAGIGVIRLLLQADTSITGPGEHRLFYDNNHFAEQGIYIVNAISKDPEQVEIVRRDPDVFQRSIHLDYTVFPPVAGAPDVAEETETPSGAEVVPENIPDVGATEGQVWLTEALYRSDLSPMLVLLVLLVSILLGGLHALTPGHGKTLVAAYLIGSRGTVAHAMFLGGIVTFTHTASVIVIGVLALAASQFIVPDVLVPALEVISGLLVVFIGIQLIWNRWREVRTPGDETSHHHHHHDDHSHGHPHHHHDDHHHDHDHDHHHHIPDRVTLRDLLALGISGGMVPCPEALGIMLIAIGLNRILLGLGMVVAFSFGLAAVLIAIGILLVRAKSLLDNVSSAGRQWQTWLPLASAIIVTLLGLAIMAKGLWSYVGGV
jgi:nickel/cobalt exporter